MAEINSFLGLFAGQRPIVRPTAPQTGQIPPTQRPGQTGPQAEERPQSQEVQQAQRRPTGGADKAPLNLLPSDANLEHSIQQARLDQQRGAIIPRGALLNLVL